MSVFIPYGEVLQKVFPSAIIFRLNLGKYIHSVCQDHAGHIFGVDSKPMIEKLEQYNVILEVVKSTPFTFSLCRKEKKR